MKSVPLLRGQIFHTGAEPSYAEPRLLSREDQEFLLLVGRLNRNCEVCGADIGDRHGNTRYCVPCGIDKHATDCRQRECEKRRAASVV